MKREIYEVHISYVNSDGYHAVDPSTMGYPKVVDSKANNNDLELARRKAYGYLGAAESLLANRDDQVSYCWIIRVSDGKQIEKRLFGKLADLPDPEPEPQPEPEPEPTPEEGV